MRSELVRTRWTIPRLGDPPIDGPLGATSAFVEGRYRFKPRFFAAARIDGLTFSKIRGEQLFGGLPETWDAPVSRIEAGGGMYVQRNLTLRAVVQRNSRDGGRVRQRTFVSGEIALLVLTMRTGGAIVGWWRCCWRPVGHATATSGQASPAVAGTIRGRIEVRLAVGVDRTAARRRRPRNRRRRTIPPIAGGAWSISIRRRARRSTRGTSRAHGWISATRRSCRTCWRLSPGTTVDFPNNDKTYHNVFSLSKAKSFDLGRYAAGRSKPVRFDEPGIVRVFCEIHSHMSAFILVFAHRYFAVTDDEGRYRLDNVPARHVHGKGLERDGTWRSAEAIGHDARRRRRRRRRFPGPMSALSSLTNRIFFATAFLAVLCIGVAIAIVNVAVTRQAEDELRHGLDEAGALVAGYRSIRFEHFVERGPADRRLAQAEGGGGHQRSRDGLSRSPRTTRTRSRPISSSSRGAGGCSSRLRRSGRLRRELMAMPWIAQRIVRPRGHRLLAGRARHPAGACRCRSASIVRSPAICTSA